MLPERLGLEDSDPDLRLCDELTAPGITALIDDAFADYAQRDQLCG